VKVPKAKTNPKALDAAVKRLGVERSKQQTLLTLQEQSRSSVLTEYQETVLASQTALVLKRLDLQLDIERVGRRYQTRLVAGDQIGTVRLLCGKDHLDVLVEPKVGNAAFLRMLEFCYGSIQLQDEALAYESKAPAPAFVVGFIVRQIEAFLNRKRHRDYSRRFEPASRHPKGHLDLASYVAQQFPKGKLDVLPCSFFDFSENVFENQVLASTLFVAGRLASSFPPDARAEIAERVAQARRHLPGVEVRRVSEAELNRFRYSRRSTCFKPLHDLCRIILFNSSVSLEPGRRLSFMSFSLNMAELFERYVRGLFQRLYGIAVVPPKSALRFPIHGTESSFVSLDGFLKERPRCVIECKYKLVDSADGLDFDEGRMKNADVFQCVAYAVHSDVEAEHALLFYPTARPDSGPLEVATTVRSFLGGGRQVVPLTVILVNLAATPARVMETLPAVLLAQFGTSVKRA
jgi:5-methylcytosine-specific restriction endonuclease McrBC regulatory subunit McrC